MSAKRSRVSEEEVLLAFSVEPAHDRRTLEHYLHNYPEHAKALVDCSNELLVDLTLSENRGQVTTEAVVEREWQYFQSLVQSSGGSSPAENPFAKLSPTAFKSMARKLDVSNVFLLRLRDRAINTASIPRRFVQRLAAEFGVTAESVMAYLSSPPTMVSGHSLRSAIHSTAAAQMSFEQAVGDSQLTPAQQDALRALVD